MCVCCSGVCPAVIQHVLALSVLARVHARIGAGAQARQDRKLLSLPMLPPRMLPNHWLSRMTSPAASRHGQTLMGAAGMMGGGCTGMCTGT